MLGTMRSRPAEYLAKKPNFMKVAGSSFGVLFGIVLVWQLGAYGGVGWWLFLGVLAAAAGWCWAYGMWFVCGNDLQRNAAASPQKGNLDKNGG